ncbi:uncharacterized protein BYT42DRAFT_562725 [Radiomyces spectabilis]|uniref:uncharacterized protein n=1 Tax=Radiomyces spectabilis TaxID=64574 RepID=UPI0022212159|nr:uncharacterized protein BYT42DRAFT_562725 [Radiomyces spectabilis]KAI8384503.1 hypothetical protein BYT42DRAFT_562725 [Radiomyces spectabilis]
MTAVPNMKPESCDTCHSPTSTMTREDLLALARHEYARQLARYTRSQMKKRVPNSVADTREKQRRSNSHNFRHAGDSTPIEI